MPYDTSIAQQMTPTDRLRHLRMRLINLKNDRSTPTKTLDVVTLYDQLCGEFNQMRSSATLPSLDEDSNEQGNVRPCTSRLHELRP